MLSRPQMVLTINMLIKKMYIYAKGLEKRNKVSELSKVKKNIHYWINMMEIC